MRAAIRLCLRNTPVAAEESAMTVNEYAERFFDLPVVEFRSGDRVTRTDVVYRLTQDWNAKEGQRELLEELLAQVDPARLRALIIGRWGGDSDEPPAGYLQALIERRLPGLRALFVGDMTSEDCEISWIRQGDYSGLIEAYPDLEVLRIRGKEDLKLPRREYRSLRELTIESGGLPSSIVEAIGDSSLPQLRKLELWLGADDYGFDGDLSTYQRLLGKIRPERLSYLGLRNSQIADELAVYLSGQEWLGCLDTLDLSMGTIGDEGAAALCESPHIRGVKVLDLRHHFISAPLVKRLQLLPLTLHIDGPQDIFARYVQVGE